MEIVFRGAPGCFQGTWTYIGGRSRSVDARGAHEGGGAPTYRGRTGHPRGRLACFLSSTPSPLDHVCSKNHAPKGFIPFGLCRGIVTSDVLVKGLSCGAIATRKLEGVNRDKGHERVYTVSAPYDESKSLRSSFEWIAYDLITRERNRLT